MKEKLDNLFCKFIKFYSKTWFSRTGEQFVKILSNSKIDCTEEYDDLRACSCFYHRFLCISRMRGGKKDYDKLTIAQDVLDFMDEIHSVMIKLPISEEGVTYQWLEECIHFGEEIKNDFTLFLTCPNDELFAEIVKKCIIFCRSHEWDYQEWQRELDKYHLGVKRFTQISSVLIAILTALLLFYAKEIGRYTTLQENKFIEEDSSYEEYLEEPIEMILTRKL